MTKLELLDHIVKLWDEKKFSRATDLLKKYNISSKEFARALLRSMNEDTSDTDVLAPDLVKISTHKKSNLDKTIIRALQEPVSTAISPSVAGTIPESIKVK